MLFYSYLFDLYAIDEKSESELSSQGDTENENKDVCTTDSVDLMDSDDIIIDHDREDDDEYLWDSSQEELGTQRYLLYNCWRFRF